MKPDRIRIGATITNDISAADPECVSYILDKMHTEAASELMKRISDGTIYLIRKKDKEKYIDRLCEKELTTTIDVTELVRCKDCKHRHLNGLTWDCPFGLSGGEYFFCAYGSKMEVK